MDLSEAKFLQPKQILVRPEPKKDESWLGYLLRLAAENGYTGLSDLGRVIDHTPISLLMSDPKTTMQSMGIQASNCKVPQPSKTRTSGLGAKLFATGRCRHFKVCPQCLFEDAHPYLRSQWDGPIAFSGCCPVHSCALLDACPGCGQPAWPRSASLRGLYKDKAYPVHICPLCEHDLRDAQTVPRVNVVDTLMSGVNFANHVHLSDAAVCASEFAATLWAVSQLFIRNRSNRKIGKCETPEGHLARLLQNVEARSVEYLNIAQRQALTNVSAALFRQWPQEFCEFCARHGIAAEHFSVYRTELVPWFREVIDKYLAKHRRGITNLQVDEARMKLQAEGTRITKAAIGRIVGTVDAKSVMSVVVTRKRATVKERQLFWRCIETYLSRSVSRKSSKELRYRNAFGILLAVLSRQEDSVILSLNETAVESLVTDLSAQFENSADGAREIRLLLKVANTYRKFRTARSHKRPLLENCIYFENFRGLGSALRAVRQALRECMMDFPTELNRSTNSFWTETVQVNALLSLLQNPINNLGPSR